MAPSFPHLIFGTITGTGSTNATVILDNLTKGESIESTTNGSGQYSFDCQNFPSGYSDEDSLVVRISTGTLIAERLSATINKTSLFQIHNIDKIKVI